MKKILVFNFDHNLLKNHQDYEIVNYFDKSIDYIITDDITVVNKSYHDLVLRNIEHVEYDVKRSVELYDIGLRLKGYSILSSNCMAGFFNQFICNAQIGPCAFWRFDPKDFYDLLMKDQEEFLHSFSENIKFFDHSGHYYAKDAYRTISFNHYKKKTNDEVKAIYLKRLASYNPNKVLIVLGLDRHTFSYEEVLACAEKYPNVVIVTNYSIAMDNVFSYENKDEQFYLKCMKFLNYCDLTQLDKLVPKKITHHEIHYDAEAMRQFNLVITLIDDVNNKREQLKILSKRLQIINCN